MSYVVTHPFPVLGRCHIAHAQRACPPSSEITSRIEVCMAFVITFFALELCLFLSVFSFGMSTPRTSLAGMPGIFFRYSNTHKGSFIAYHVQKLGERPGMKHPVYLPGSFSSISNTKKLLNMKNTSSASDDIYDLTTNLVVVVCSPSGLLSLGSLNHTDLPFLLEALPI